MTEKTVEQLIENIVTLPTIPKALAKLNTVIDNLASSAPEIAEVVATDQSVATKVLRISNSTFYGLRNKVTSLPTAVSILGTRVIKNIVLQVSTIQAYQHLRNNPDFDVDGFWKHSVLSGICAQILAKYSKTLPGKPDEYYAIGLIHDIGRVILLDCKTEEFLKSVRLANASDNKDVAAAEQEVFGFNHTHVGEVLARRWKLTEEVAQGIRLHHDPPSGEDALKLTGCLIGVAGHLAYNLKEKGEKDAAVGLNPVALDLLGIPVEEMPVIAEEIATASSKIEI